jgi:hypothetical protein
MSRIIVDLSAETIVTDNEFFAPSFQTQADVKKQQIQVLELQITPRRLREAIMGVDNGWLSEKEAEIEAIRETI